MNAAYIIAMTALVLAILAGLLGAALATSEERVQRDVGPWILTAAAVLVVGAFAFAGVGVNIQYYG